MRLHSHTTMMHGMALVSRMRNICSQATVDRWLTSCAWRGQLGANLPCSSVSCLLLPLPLLRESTTVPAHAPGQHTRAPPAAHVHAHAPATPHYTHARTHARTCSAMTSTSHTAMALEMPLAPAYHCSATRPAHTAASSQLHTSCEPQRGMAQAGGRQGGSAQRGMHGSARRAMQPHRSSCTPRLPTVSPPCVQPARHTYTHAPPTQRQFTLSTHRQPKSPIHVRLPLTPQRSLHRSRFSSHALTSAVMVMALLNGSTALM